MVRGAGPERGSTGPERPTRGEREALGGAVLERTYDDRGRLVGLRVGRHGFVLDPDARTGAGFGGHVAEHTYAYGVYSCWFGDDEHGDTVRRRMGYDAFVAVATRMARRWVVEGAAVRTPAARRAALAYIAEHRLIEGDLYGSAVEAIVERGLRDGVEAAVRAVRTQRVESRFTAALRAAPRRRTGPG